MLGNEIERTKDKSSSPQRWSEDTLQGRNHHVFELGLHIHTISPFNTDFPNKRKQQNFSSDSAQITSYTCLLEAEVNLPVCKLHGQELVETGMVGLLQDANLIKKARCLQVRHTR